MRGNARSFAPIIIGIRKLPSTAGIDGIRKKNTIITPCMREQLVVGLGRDAGRPAASAARGGSAAAKRPPTKKNDRDRDQVQHARCACGPSSAATTQRRGRRSGSSASGSWRVHHGLLLLTRCGRAPARWPAPCAVRRRPLQRLDVRDELQQLLFADQALEGRHQRLEALRRPSPAGSGSTRGGRPRRRRPSLPSCELAPCVPKMPVERRAAARAVVVVAGDAGELAGTACSPRCASVPGRPPPLQPRLVVAPAPSRRPCRSCPSASCRSTPRRTGGTCRAWSPRTRASV